MNIESKEIEGKKLPELDAVNIIASLMCVSARTAPKGRGIDTIVTRIASDDDLLLLADKMEELGGSNLQSIFIRDAKNIRESQACVLIGSMGFIDTGLNCGGCGFPTCKEMKEKFETDLVKMSFSGPNCVIRMTDLGIAVGSAAKTAQIHNADNRILYTAGVSALALNLLPECTCAYGIPLSITGKNIFFDRRA